MVRHSPADHAPVKGSNYHGQIQKADGGRHEGEVCYPQLVRAVCREVSLHQIRGPGFRTVVARFLRRLIPRKSASHIRRATRFLPTRIALRLKLGVDPRGTVGPSRLGVDRLDLLG